MERTKRPTPNIDKIDISVLGSADLILTGDWHLREDSPICRTDDFQKALWGKIDFICYLQSEHGCPVIHSGDLFNHWKPSPYLLAKTMEHLPSQFYTIFGNHDLPQHNLELADRCGINVLEKAGKLQVLDGCHWKQIPEKISYDLSLWMGGPIHIGMKEVCKRKILVWHVMTYQGKEPWPGCTDPKAASLLRKYPEYDFILTGHNHKPFVEEYQGRLLLNPGSISRQEAGQIDYKPCVWLYYAEMNKVVPVYIPIKEDAVSREHLDIQEQRESRIDSFISKLNTDWEASLSFEDNLEIFRQENDIRESVMDIIYKSLEV